MQNYFELFHILPNFVIDLNTLEKTYQIQVAQQHPDKFATKSNKEKMIAMQNTSLINTAFDTLQSPLLRATYLLELQGINAFNEKDTNMDVSFLMNQIELRELLEEIKITKNKVALDNFIKDITNKIKRNIYKIQISFERNILDSVKKLVRELKFYMQLNIQANQLIDEWL